MLHKAPPGSHDGGLQLLVNNGYDSRLCLCGCCNKIEETWLACVDALTENCSFPQVKFSLF